MGTVGFVDFAENIPTEKSRDTATAMAKAIGNNSSEGNIVVSSNYAFLDDDNIITVTKESMYLFRDPMGLKPIFYTTVGNRLIFASAIQALLAHSGVEAKLDINGLKEIFALGPARYEHSGIFNKIHALPPGYFIKIKKGSPFILEKYWDVTPHIHTHSEEETINNVRKLLLEGILSRLKVNDNTCALLSGGVDSSVVTAVMAEKYRKEGKQLQTFSFDFRNSASHFKSSVFQPDLDRPWVDKMVEYCNTRHEYLECGPEDLIDSLYAAVDARGLPGMADVDASLLYFCSKLPKEIKTVFTGEVADEIFGGYPWFHKGVGDGVSLFPWSRDFETRKVFLKDEWIEKLKLEATSAEYCKKTLLDSSAEDELPARGYLTLKWFMPTLLERMERIGSYCGLKAELPFADVKLIEYVWNIPWTLKNKNNTVKYVLREAARGIVPDEVLFRKKSPFPKTYDPAYTALVAERLNDVLADVNAPIREFIDVSKAKDFIADMIKDPNTSRPWFGQLMAGPQMMAYLLQLDYWFRKYKVVI